MLLLFFAMALVTYLPRAAPMVLLSRLEMPAWLVRWLSCVPAAVLAGLLAPSLLIRQVDGAQILWLSWDNHHLLAAVPTFLVAVRTRNMFAAILGGLLSVFALNYLF